MAIDATRTPKPGFGHRGPAPRTWAGVAPAPRTWAGVAPAAKVAKRSRNVAPGAAGGIGLVGLYALLSQPSCERPVDVAKAEAERGRLLTDVERADLADQARQQEDRCRRGRPAWWSTGRAFSGARRGWFSHPAPAGMMSTAGASRPATTSVSRGGFGRSGFSFGG